MSLFHLCNKDTVSSMRRASTQAARSRQTAVEWVRSKWEPCVVLLAALRWNRCFVLFTSIVSRELGFRSECVRLLSGVKRTIKDLKGLKTRVRL